MASQTGVCSMGFVCHKASKVRRHKGFVKAAAIKQSQTAPPKKANDQRSMAKSFPFSAFRFPLFIKRKEARLPEPLLLLINQLIVLRAVAWECDTCATDDWFAYVVATLGYNLVNINLWSRIAQNILFHSVFEILNC